MRGFFTAVLLVLAATQAAWAEDTPLTLAGVTVVGAAQAKALIDAGQIKVLDLRKKASFADGHLPSAASAAAAYVEADKRLDAGGLGVDRAAPLLLYSHGPDGWKSYWAAKSAVEAGFTAVYWMRGGVAEWDAKGLPLER
jgi:rhodanese-related sulfurtransferase